MRKNGSLVKKAVEGTLVLGVRRVLIQVIFTLSNIFLARLLFPQDFGTFAIVSFTLVVFTVFCDLGLGPSLVQKKGDVTVLDLRTAFTIQFILALSVIAIIFAITPLFIDFYQLEEKNSLLFRLYSLHLLLIPFKNTCGALLERRLEYKKVVTVEILDTLCGSLVTVSGAIAGLGVLSFAIGAVAGRFFGALLYSLLGWWSFGFAFSKRTLVALTKFGLPYQINVILGLFYGPFVLLYLGKRVGSENLGYFQFAASLAVLPLAFSEIINRVIFPLGARLQSNKEVLGKIIERSIVVVSITTLPLLALGLSTAREIINFVYTDRWLPALPALYLGLVQTSVMAYTGIFSQLLLAKGRAKDLRNMSLVWAILTWLLAPPLISAFSFVGMSLAGLVVSLSGIWLFIRLKQEIEFSIFAKIAPYFVGAVFAGLFIYSILSFLPHSILSLILAVSLGFCAYVTIITVLAKKEFFSDLLAVWNLVWGREGRS